jgi:hypothetical protein
MSKIIQLAAGQVTRADSISIDLVTPTDAPAMILVRWPQAPSVAEPTPRALANIARAMVGITAEAQSRLAAIRAAGR